MLVGPKLICYGSEKKVLTRKGDDAVTIQSATNEATKSVSFARGPIGLHLETDTFLGVTTVKGFNSKDSPAKACVDCIHCRVSRLDFILAPQVRTDQEGGRAHECERQGRHRLQL